MTKAKILVTGSTGFVGTNLVSVLKKEGAEVFCFSGDLRNRDDASRNINSIFPDYVIHLAASVGGIGANLKHPGQFCYENLLMSMNLIDVCKNCVKKPRIIALGTVCAYPKFTPVPFKEEDLWSGYPEETNAYYGVAKRAIITLLEGYFKEYGLESFILMPTNLYGPFDHFDLENSHVIPALIRKFDTAKNKNEKYVRCWGSGEVSRDFLYVKDLTRAIVKVIKLDYKFGWPGNVATPINVGSGKEVKICDLVEEIKSMVGYTGEVIWELEKPDGQPRRVLDISKAKKILNWSPKYSLAEGLSCTYEWYKNNL